MVIVSLSDLFHAVSINLIGAHVMDLLYMTFFFSCKLATDVSTGKKYSDHRMVKKSPCCRRTAMKNSFLCIIFTPILIFWCHPQCVLKEDLAIFLEDIPIEKWQHLLSIPAGGDAGIIHSPILITRMYDYVWIVMSISDFRIQICMMTLFKKQKSSSFITIKIVNQEQSVDQYMLDRH